MNSGLLIFLVLAALGLSFGVAGVYLLTGLGWAMLAAGASLLMAAGFVRKGLTSG